MDWCRQAGSSLGDFMFGILNWFKNLPNILKNSSYLYYCPVCERPVKDFMPLPDFYREQAELHGYLYSLDDAETLNYKQYSCPHCSSSDRERLYALFLREKAACHESKRKLDIVEFAPVKPLGQMIKKLGVFKIRTADLFLKEADDKVNLEDMTLYPDEVFDCFICSHVLEHVSDDTKALRELLRILKPGGWGILMVPIILSLNEIDEDPSLTDEGERWRRFGQNDHLRMYSKKGFIRRAEEAGFTVKQYGWQHFSSELFNKAGIEMKSIMYVVEKTGNSLNLLAEPA